MSQKGELNLRIGDVIAMVALVIVILIGAIVAGNLKSVSDTIAGDLNDADYNSTVSTLFANTWTALVLASVGIIIAAAVGILALVMGSLGRSAGGIT